MGALIETINEFGQRLHNEEISSLRLMTVLKRQVSEEQIKYRCLADSLPQIIWTADPEGIIDYVNQKWTTYTGLTLAETRRQGWQSVGHPNDLKTVRETWSQCVKLGQDYDVECRIRRKSDGKYRWHRIKAHPVLDDDGTLIQWFGITTDIHDQKTNSDTSDKFYSMLPQGDLP